MGAGDRRVGELVQPQRQPLRETAVVDEDDRRPVLLDELEQGRVDRGPDRARGRLVAGRHHDVVGEDELAEAGVGARLAHVLERDDDLEVELLADPHIDELDRPAACHEAPDLLERPLRRREPDPLERLLGDPREPLQREGEMRAAFRPGDGVHLVDDHRLDAAEDLPPLRGEEQEERLGRRDQDVRRRAEHDARSR